MRSYARSRALLHGLLGLAVAACAGTTRETPAASGTAAPPKVSYWVYVAAESADLLHQVRFGPDGLSVEHTVEVGELIDETDGPHGLRMSPDGRHLYMTTAHGAPTGKLWKVEAGADTLVSDPIFLGRFPATLDVTPDGLYAVVGNFNLHGEPVPSTLSTVYLPDMVEVAQTTTCETPHGVRLSPDGRHAYSACMRDDRLVEVDTRTYRVTRQFSVAVGVERALEDAPEAERSGRAAPTCSPTWAAPWASSVPSRTPPRRSGRGAQHRPARPHGPSPPRPAGTSTWPATRRTRSWSSPSPTGG